MIKLKTGYVVNPIKLEGIYLQVENLENIFVYGDSDHDYLVALVHMQGLKVRLVS